jgi:RNA polymerase sigma-70 factor (ECF subfamily)
MTSDGSREAFREIYTRTQKYIYVRIYNIVGNQADTEDVMQEAYVKIWQNASSYDRTKGRAMTWIGAIAHHSAINYIRSRAHKLRSRTQGLDTAINMHDLSKNVDVDLYLHQRSEIIATEIKYLPRPQREVLEMGYINGLSYREMSAITGEPESTLKSRARRAILKLKEKLENEKILSEY